MPISAEIVEVLCAKLDTTLPHLDERAVRLMLGAEARSVGHGGSTSVGRASGVALSRIQRGVSESEGGFAPMEGIRKPGAGCQTPTEPNPGLVRDFWHNPPAIPPNRKPGAFSIFPSDHRSQFDGTAHTLLNRWRRGPFQTFGENQIAFPKEDL